MLIHNLRLEHKLVRLFLALFAFLLSPDAQSERILGLVEIPVLHGVNEGKLDRAMSPVALYLGPSHDSEVAIVVRDRKQLESREHSYEAVSAVVYGYKRDSGSRLWYKLKYSHDGKTLFGWLSHGNTGTYRQLHTILETGLTFFTDNWDQKIYELPDFSANSKSFPELGERADVQVADTAFRGDDLWFLVVLIRGNYCSGGGTEIIASGWVPAYAENDKLTVWHYSRGC